MKKTFFWKFFLFAVISTLVVATSCKDYEDDIDMLNDKIEKLDGSSTSMKTELESAIGTVKASAAAADANAAAAQAVADAAAATGGDAADAAAAAQTKADSAGAATVVAQAAADAAQNKANTAHTAAVTAQQTANANALEIIANAHAAQVSADAAANALLIAQGAQEGANAAATAAQAAADAAGTAQNAADNAQGVADNALAAAQTAHVKADQLIDDLGALLIRVTAVEGKAATTQAQLDELAGEVATMKAKVMELFGKRITSITLVPKQHINMMPAIVFNSVGFMPQEYNPNHGLYGYTTEDIADANPLATDNESAIVEFRLNPRNINKESIGTPFFDVIVSQNTITTYSVNTDKAFRNSPIKPVEGQDLVISDEGILKLKVTKTIDDLIRGEFDQDFTNNDLQEKFYFASLGIPIADKFLTEEEKGNGGAVITSEHYRVHEKYILPRIKNAKAGEIVKAFDIDGIETGAPLHYQPYALDANSLPVHYSSANMLYASDICEKIDFKVDWKESLDLNDLVTVGTEHDHATLENYADYGLEFRFELVEEYKPLADPINQQLFAKIDEDGLLSAQEPTIDGIVRISVGHEPIIRVSLINTKAGDKLVDQRYIKVKFTKGTQQLPEYIFAAQDVSCENIVNTLGTELMNTNVYSKLGMTKDEFHNTFSVMEIGAIKKGGTALTGLETSVEADATKDVQFYKDANNNFVWEMNPETVGEVNPETGSTYTISLVFKEGGCGAWGDVTMDFVMSVKLPEAPVFAYQGTYWKGGIGEDTFNVNPIVFNSSTHPSVGDSHIEANLVNGYINKNTAFRPANIGEVVSGLGTCGDVMYVFDSGRFNNYAHLAGYKVGDEGASLWNGTPGIVSGDFDYPQDNKMAASINSKIDLTQANSIIRLHEKSTTEGTDAAKALIGKKVPVNMVVAYNSFNKITVQSFEVHFIDPLAMEANFSASFTDADDSGSFIKIGILKDWRSTEVTIGSDLFNYYAVKDVTFDIPNVGTNLEFVGDTYSPVAGVKNGNLPTGNSFKALELDKVTETLINPHWLAFFNNSGTPVNVNFSLFVDVKTQYKWGAFSNKDMEIVINKNPGTPGN